jgi:hypothetical protein
VLETLFFLTFFFAIQIEMLLNNITIVLIVKAIGNSNSFNQSGLDLLTIYALVSPAKVIDILNIENKSIIFFAFMVFKRFSS